MQFFGLNRLSTQRTPDGSPSVALRTAEFIAELTSGPVSNTHLPICTKGREKETEIAFVVDENKTDKPAWLVLCQRVDRTALAMRST